MNFPYDLKELESLPVLPSLDLERSLDTRVGGAVERLVLLEDDATADVQDRMVKDLTLAGCARVAYDAALDPQVPLSMERTVMCRQWNPYIRKKLEECPIQVGNPNSPYILFFTGNLQYLRKIRKLTLASVKSSASADSFAFAVQAAAGEI